MASVSISICTRTQAMNEPWLAVRLCVGGKQLSIRVDLTSGRLCGVTRVELEKRIRGARDG